MHRATLKVSMPAPPTDPAPGPPNPTSGAQDPQSSNDPASDDHESAAPNTAGSTIENSAAVTTANPPNRLAPTPDAAAIPNKTSTTPEEGDASVHVKKLPKGKRFRPSQAKTEQYALQYPLFYSHSPHPGVCLSVNGTSQTPTEPRVGSTIISVACQMKSARYVGETTSSHDPIDIVP